LYTDKVCSDRPKLVGNAKFALRCSNHDVAIRFAFPRHVDALSQDSSHVSRLQPHRTPAPRPWSWNAWRMENPAVVPNLTGIALSVGERQMGPINGGPINLSSARLRHASLRFAMLTGADLSTVGLWDADLSDARLDRANLAGADLSEALLDRAISLALDSRAPISRGLVRRLSLPLVHLPSPPPRVAPRPLLIKGESNNETLSNRDAAWSVGKPGLCGWRPVFCRERHRGQLLGSRFQARQRLWP